MENDPKRVGDSSGPMATCESSEEKRGNRTNVADEPEGSGRIEKVDEGVGLEDDELVELGPVCFCGDLNCEDESHHDTEKNKKVCCPPETKTPRPASADDSEGPANKKMKPSCCDTMDCEKSPAAPTASLDTARTEDPVPVDVAPMSRCKGCGPKKKCTCGQLSWEEESEENSNIITAREGSAPPTDTPKSCCGDLDCPQEATPSNAAALPETPKPIVGVEDAGCTTKSCCGPKRKCTCGQLNCEDDTHIKLDGAQLDFPTTTEGTKSEESINHDTDSSHPDCSSGKKPYKVKMNIHQRWNNLFAKLKEFHQEHRTFIIPRTHPDKSLDRWVNRQRSSYHRGQLKPKRVTALDAIGFDWGQPPKHKGDTWITTKPWHERFEQLMEFKEWHGHCKVPTKYEEDPSLNRWVWKQQREYAKGKLTKEQIRCLKSLGLPWLRKDGDKSKKGDCQQESEAEEEIEEESEVEEVVAVEIPVIKSSWDQMFEDLVKFKAECGHTNATTKHNQKLGTWTQRQRTHYRQKSLHPERIKKLESIGFQWRAPHANFVPRTWKDQWYMLKKYKEENNHVNVPADYQVDKLLARWVQHQRRDRKNGFLTQDQIAQLNELGFEWEGIGADVTAATNNAYTEKNQRVGAINTNEGGSTTMDAQQQLLLAQQRALARHYEDLAQQQAIATQRQALIQQQDAYTALIAHQQFAFSQLALFPGQLSEAAEATQGLQRISEAAEATQAVEWMKQQRQTYPLPTAGPHWPPAWGWNPPGELAWVGGAASAAEAAAKAAATTATLPVTAAAPAAEAPTITAEVAATPTESSTSTAVATTETAPEVAATTIETHTQGSTSGIATAAAAPPLDKKDGSEETEGTQAAAPTIPAVKLQTSESKRIQELEQENLKLQEENLKLRQEKLELMRENTGLHASIEETRQSYLKEKKTLQHQVEEHSSQLQQQVSQTKAQGDLMAELMKQVLEMKQFQEKMQQMNQNPGLK